MTDTEIMCWMLGTYVMRTGGVVSRAQCGLPLCMCTKGGRWTPPQRGAGDVHTELLRADAAKTK